MLQRLPIFSKELIEVANRKQTYLIRVLYAAVISAFFYLRYSELEISGGDFITGLGVGGRLYQTLLSTQFVLIMLVVPPLVASAITIEKENKTIHLLLTLPVSSFNFLIQKYAGRLLPVISLILISTPLFGFSFVLGGVTSRMVLLGTVNCILTALSVGAVALAVSCYRDTSARATIETYLYLLVLGPSCLSPILVTSGSNKAGPVFFAVLIALIFFTMGMWIAMKHFRSRALQKPEADPVFVQTNINHRKVYTYRWGLPVDAPVTWLEHIKYPMRHREYAGAAALIVVAVFGLGVGSYGTNTCLGLLVPVLLFMNFSVLFRAQHATLKFKQNQVLPNLLTTPLTEQEILKQLFTGRYYGIKQYLLAIGLIGLAATLQPISARGFNLESDIIHFLVLLVVLPLTTGLYFCFLAWLGIGSALTARNGLQALTFGVGFMAILLIGIPLFFPADSIPLLHAWQPRYLFQRHMEVLDDQNGHVILHLFATAINLAIWSGLFLLLRGWILKNARRLLTRQV